jgi:hypothetical protein
MPTLSDLLEALCRHPGMDCERFTTGVQTQPPVGPYLGRAAGDDAQRQVVSSDLADLNLSGDGTDTDPSWFSGWYLHLPGLGLQRRVAASGFSAAEDAAAATDQTSSDEKVGVLTLTRGLGAAVAPGQPAALYSPLPPLEDADRKPSLRSQINRALDTLRMPVRLTLMGVQNSYSYSMAAYPWIKNEGDLIRVSDRAYTPNEDPYVLPGYSRLRFDGGTAYLILEAPIPAGQPFSVDVYRPRKTWIAPYGSAFADSAVGLVHPDDLCTGPTETIALLAYWFVAKDLETRSAAGTDTMWARNAASVAAAAAPYLAWAQPEGPHVRSADAAGSWGDSPVFLARRGGGSSGRWG